MIHNLLQRNFRYWELRSTKYKAAKEAEVNAARHLQQRVEVWDWRESTEPAAEADASMPMWNSNRIEERPVTDKVEHDIHLLCFRQPLGELRPLKLHPLRSKPKKLLKTGLIARGCDHLQPCVGGNIQGCLPEGRSRATKKERLPLFNLQIAIETGPCRSVRLWYHSELLPRQSCRDLHDIRSRYERQFCVTAIDRSAHAAHERGHFITGLKFSAWCCNHLADTLNSDDFGRLSPLAFTHMRFGVVHAERLHRDQNVTALRLRVRKLLDHQAFQPAKTTQDNCAHLDTSEEIESQSRLQIDDDVASRL